MYIVSTVQFDDGKTDRELILDAKSGQADKLHHAHQASCKSFWRGWKAVIGGSYQAFDNLADAMANCL